MCGIFAILSKDDYKLISECVEALEYLEYRGYDSVGLAYKTHNNNINVDQPRNLAKCVTVE